MELGCKVVCRATVSCSQQLLQRVLQAADGDSLPEFSRSTESSSFKSSKNWNQWIQLLLNTTDVKLSAFQSCCWFTALTDRLRRLSTDWLTSVSV